MTANHFGPFWRVTPRVKQPDLGTAVHDSIVTPVTIPVGLIHGVGLPTSRLENAHGVARIVRRLERPRAEREQLQLPRLEQQVVVDARACEYHRASAAALAQRSWYEFCA